MERVAHTAKNAPRKAAAALRAGHVVVLPTDTLYGFAALMSHASSLRQIAHIKQQSTDKRFLFLAATVDMVGAYIASWGCTSREEMVKVWPAPLTAILPAIAGPEGGDVDDTVAFRVPADDWLRAIIADVGEPIASTSVNRSGEAPFTAAADIASAFRRDIDLIVERDANSASPSTLVDFTGEEPVVLREGDYAWATRGKPSN